MTPMPSACCNALAVPWRGAQACASNAPAGWMIEPPR